MDERVRVGILGCGHVGGALVRLIHDHADVIEARAGVPLEVARVAVHDLTKDRDLPLPTRCFTDDPGAVVDDPDVDIVVEVIGGIEPARRLIVEALMGGKPVVTANKELVATHGRELFETAEGAGVDILFEASVGGGIPLIRPLRESLAGDRIRRVMGIVNGTTNYILTGMTELGTSFADALAEAQRLGFAETDPTADVEGFDAAAKAAIIASIAFGARVVAGDVYREGITDITADDIASARDLGYVVKLLAIAEDFDGEIAVRVHPAMVPEHHPLASVRDARCLEQWRVPFEQRDHRCGVGDRQVLAVRLDQAGPAGGAPAHSSSPITRSTEPTRCTGSRSATAAAAARRSASRALWVTKMRRASSPMPRWRIDRTDTCRLPNSPVIACRTPGRSATSICR
jgi:homoserine dehydrogenase